MNNFKKMSVNQLSDLIIESIQNGNKKKAEIILGSLPFLKKSLVIATITKKCNNIK